MMMIMMIQNSNLYSVIFGHKDKDAGSNFKITMFFGESETTTPNAVCLHDAPIYHQL